MNYLFLRIESFGNGIDINRTHNLGLSDLDNDGDPELLMTTGTSSNPLVIKFENRSREIIKSINPVTGNVIIPNDSDPDGDTLSIDSFDATSVEGGTISMDSEGNFTYTPPDGLQENTQDSV